ncbi:MAG: beta-N-acetylhexosaminidase [Alphaproteobacteria bacterium]|nr:beta-N-acetylhexosaminidase [Alphaproteobacteria bacterium]
MLDKTTPAPGETPRAVILGCGGEQLGADERRFFGAADPVGFILFRRNCRSPEQVRELVSALRDVIGRSDAPILIDQEGGRVARLRPPFWRLYPSAACLGSLPDLQAEAAVRLGARLIADDLGNLGITVDCLPVLDVPVAGADPVIGDRAYGTEPGRVTKLARAACHGLLEGGVLPVIKHIPGHGRARVDSHNACPVVETEADELSRTDFAPFHALAAMPWAMSAHIVYMAIDPTAPATLSRRVISEAIRGGIGFDGVLVSDDLSMQALGGDIAERAERALSAGCDLVLHCNGDRREMEAILTAARSVSTRTAERLARAEAMRRRCTPRDFDRRETEQRFDALLAGARIEELPAR